MVVSVLGIIGNLIVNYFFKLLFFYIVAYLLYFYLSGKPMAMDTVRKINFTVRNNLSNQNSLGYVKK